MIRIALVVIVFVVPLFSEGNLLREPTVTEKIDREVESSEAMPRIEVTPNVSAEEEQFLEQENSIPSFDLEAHLKEIKESKGDERRVLMNQLKTELKAMNKEKRSMVLKSLRSFGQGEQLQQGMHQQRQQQQRGNGQHLQRGQP